MRRAVGEIVDAMRRETERGRTADYIPQLQQVDVKRFGLAVTTMDGEVVAGGDCDEPFSIQSVSKVFTLTLALGKIGDQIWQRVGREPSGNAFNSIVQLEHEDGVPRNPFINAGAITVTDIILEGQQPRATIGSILRFVRELTQANGIYVDKAVARSEAATGFRNHALAHYMKSFGTLANPVDAIMGVYFHQCAMAMSCRQLASAGRYLAMSGQQASGLKIISAAAVRRINALMLTCGHYDGSGDFAFRVGLPGKSGVGGGILAIVPEVASIAVWSPGLNRHGNSLLGTLALEQLAKTMGWSIFARPPKKIHVHPDLSQPEASKE
ncbi:glutaminase [Ensifer sp. ENS02]|uniref:glutaminase n=1 Tax=Ensifer sp. ENS02 TaxID=2769290 RepID=UPI0024854812|nr:glutaminase [Ensifer sp. ENS02]